MVCVQHEYGIYGGAAGTYLLKLLDRVKAPVVVTLHTVLEQPSPEQRSVIEGLVRRASRLVVMAEKGRQILRDVHGVADDRIAVVLHGVPDRPLGDGAKEKAQFGLSGHRVLLTFGLLSPNKGIETVIRAMPAIVAAHPDTLYVVLGATHPHLVAREGEAYRERLMALAEELGVSAHVRFVDGFVEQERLLDYIAAADIYVTPYLNEAQIVSGTLSYAVALGRPVVSTPYWHAVELLAEGRGLLVDFGDSAGFAERITSLLDDPEEREARSRRCWAKGRTRRASIPRRALSSKERESDERLRPVRDRRGFGRRSRLACIRRLRGTRRDRGGVQGRRHLRDPRLRAQEAARLRIAFRRRPERRRDVRLGRAQMPLRLAGAARQRPW